MATKLKAGGGGKAPWMPKYGRDFYGDEHVLAMGTDLSGWAQKGIYDFLLWKAWDEGSIPDDVAKLAGMCGMRKTAFAKLWPAIVVCWTPHPTAPGRLVQRRLELVREQSGELSRKMKALADKRYADEAARRIAAGEHIRSDTASESACGDAVRDECDDACESGCEPALDLAVLSTSHNHKPEATMDGRMDGGTGLSPEQKGEGVRTRIPRNAGDVAADLLREVGS